MSNDRVYAMIPARYGSQRLRLKNLALIDSRPLISYAISAAVDSRCFDKVVVNSDNDVFKSVASEFNADYYKRPADLGSSQAKSDDVVYDFIQSHPDATVVAWVNPIAPLQTASDVSFIVNYFIDHKYDSLITGVERQVHCMFSGRAINYVPREKFALTQDLRPVFIFAYSIMIWRVSAFREQYEESGCAMFCGKFKALPVGPEHSVIVKTEGDLRLAESMIQAKKSKMADNVQYWTS